MSCIVSFLSFLGSPILGFSPSSPRGGQLKADPTPSNSEAPEADECRGGDDAIDSQEGSGSTTSPPPAISEEPSLDKNRKLVDELLSSSTSTQRDAPGEPSAPHTSEVEIFDALDS
jgi:hypothetical protein